MTVRDRRDSGRLPLPVIEARRRTAFVQRAELANHPLFRHLPGKFQVQLGNSPRLVSRLYRLLVAEFGEPAASSAASRNFHLLNKEELQNAALCLGLSYDFAVRGGALRGEMIAGLSVFCDAATLAKALRHASVVHVRVSKHDTDMPDQAVLEANGWSLLRLWADSNGVNSSWRISEEKAEKAELGSVSRAVACELADRILVDAAFPSEGW